MISFSLPKALESNSSCRSHLKMFPPIHWVLSTSENQVSSLGSKYRFRILNISMLVKEKLASLYIDCEATIKFTWLMLFAALMEVNNNCISCFSMKFSFLAGEWVWFSKSLITCLINRTGYFFSLPATQEHMNFFSSAYVQRVVPSFQIKPYPCPFFRFIICGMP